MLNNSYIGIHTYVAECEQLKAQNQEQKRLLELAEQSQGGRGHLRLKGGAEAERCCGGVAYTLGGT